MNYEQITGILRAILPGALAYAVGRGWITESDVGEISAAVVALGAAIWSYVSNRTGKVAGTGGVILSPGQRAGAGIGSAIIIGFFLLSGNTAHAADAAKPAPVLLTKAPVVAPVVGCSQLSCTGFSIGAVINGIGGNAAILQNGINNSVFAGGGDIGLNVAWQYWKNNVYVGFDVDGLLESQSNAGVTNFAGSNGGAVGIVHFKLGGNLVNLIADAPQPIFVPSTFASSLMASYIDNCSAFRKGGTQYCGGVGQQIWLAPKLTADVLYDSGAPTKNFNALQNVGVKVSYHF